MTYEEWLIRRAKLRCDRLYISELISASAALVIMLFYVFIKRYELMIISAFGFVLCALAEWLILVIEKKARKHINRRLKMLNKSLERTVRKFPQDRLFVEKRKFEREYKFLEKK